MTKLCVPITATTCEGMAHEIVAAAATGADIIEIRLDYLDLTKDYKDLQMLGEAREFFAKTILTCRTAEEGGHFRGDDALRPQLFSDVLYRAGSMAFLDLEYASHKRSRELRGIPLSFEKQNAVAPRINIIFSRHDLRTTPPNVSALLAEMAPEPCDVIKIACQATSILDALCMLDALREWAPRKPTIALSMGETGILTRVLAKKFGAFLTFASLEQGKESAPGQITIGEMKNLYRWDAITPQTKVYGVIGCPVAHSMSPAIMNAGFSEVGHDGVYLPLRVEPDYASFAAFMDACLARPWLDLRGCSVTIPHKENLLRYVKEHGGYIEPLAQRIGVANTLVIGDSSLITHHSSLLSAYNTDYIGALDALCTGMNCNRADLKNHTFAVLGAGGAARAIIAGLTDSRCEVTIFNRTLSKAESLAREFNAKSSDWSDRAKFHPLTKGGQWGGILINCTSIGMWPQTDESPLAVTDIPENAVVFDTVYNPIETRLLREARQRGCKTIDGVSMFINQASAQFERWTGDSAPKDLMRQVVVKNLAR